MLLRKPSFKRTLATSAAVVIAGLGTIAVQAASAHDVVIGGDPSDGEVLETFPSTLTLEFSGVPRDGGFNTFSLMDADTGEQLFSGEPTINGRFLSVDLPTDLDAGEGTYRIGFQIISSDGHSTRGGTTFYVGQNAADQSSHEGQESSNDATDASNSLGLSTPMVWAIAVVGVLAVLAAAVLAVTKARRSRDLD